VLTDTLIGLRGGLYGALAIRQGLGADLLWADGAPAAALEGASLGLFHFGRAVTASVQGGRTVFTFADSQ